MTNRIVGAASLALLLSMVGRPLPAQFKAHLMLASGAHAGSYDFGPTYGATPPACTITKNGDGAYAISITDTRTNLPAEHLASISYVLPMLPKTAAGATDFRLAIRFTGKGGGAASALQFNGAAAGHVGGTGALKFAFDGGEETFLSSFTAAAIDGSDTVRVEGIVNCKQANR